MSNSEYLSDKGETESIWIDFESKLSFLESAVLNLGEERVKSLIVEEKNLNVYNRFFESIFRMKNHILDEDRAWVYSQTGLFSEAAEKASSMLDNVDIPSPKYGKKIILNSANYVKYRQSKDKRERRGVMKAYWKNHAKYRNTFAVLLDANVKKHLFASKIKRYPDTLTASLFPKMIDNSVYLNLIDTVKKNLTPLHRYLRLKTK
jgi:oligoendopeptidase F